MLAVLAAILAGVGYILDGTGAHTSAWFGPGALTLAALACLALHFSGFYNRQK